MFQRKSMKPPKSVKTLEEFGRIRLSKLFFMRDFLYSEISQIEGIPNIPDDPELAILAGKSLCENVLEPIQEKLGRISIRSAYRSCAVNAKGAENKNQYNCSRNEANYAGHIWDKRDANGHIGATACIMLIPSFHIMKEQGIGRRWHGSFMKMFRAIPVWSFIQNTLHSTSLGMNRQKRKYLAT